MVSPMAREMPSTNAATMPLRAAGMTTLVLTCRLVLPERVGPLRRPFGTAAIASSDSEATVGTIMMPMTSPADSALKISAARRRRGAESIQRRVGVMNSSAKKPKTTVGMPGEDLQDRLDGLADAAVGVLAEVEGRREPERAWPRAGRCNEMSSVAVTSGSTP